MPPGYYNHPPLQQARLADDRRAWWRFLAAIRARVAERASRRADPYWYGRTRPSDLRAFLRAEEARLRGGVVPCPLPPGLRSAP